MWKEHFAHPDRGVADRFLVRGIGLLVESGFCGVDGLHGRNQLPMIVLQRLDELRHVWAHSEKCWKDTVILIVMVMVMDGRVRASSTDQ